MSDPSRHDSVGSAAAGKRDPDRLELRARPRPVTRFRRPVIVTAAAALAALLFALTWWALDPVRIAPFQVGEDLLRDGRSEGAESLRGLPESYEDLAPPPVLGPPLPGDLGPPLLAQERALGLSPEADAFDAESEAARAERLRLAQQARQAREAGLFFQLAQPQGAGRGAGKGAEPGAVGDAPRADGRSAWTGERATDQESLGARAAFGEAEIDRPATLEAPVSPYAVLAGTVIAASLITGVNSDLPGRVLAQVTEDVYDTATGRFRLIPQGTRLLGSYESAVSHGQARAFIFWQRLILPNGKSLRLADLPATDPAGYAGLADDVDPHTWSFLKGLVLSTFLDLGQVLTREDAARTLLGVLGRSGVAQSERAGSEILRREMDIQPTLTIRPGWPLRIIVHQDLILKPYRDEPL